MTRVFVYGTLKRGGENHGWIANQHFVAAAVTRPRYRMYDLGGYPGMIRAEDGLAIEGEVWDVDDSGLIRLDVLEDVDGGEYERMPVELEGDFADERIEGYLYLHSIAGRRDIGTTW
jgi:gamma-glutamylcyclotransferase (GGCT)/AIG2-like uncharacterized protein YtfP